MKIGPYDTGKVYQGDCLELMKALPDKSIDVIITDPPYSSGGQFRGDRAQSTNTKYVQTTSVDTCREEFAGDNRDQRAFLAWCSMWMTEALRACRPGAVMLTFTDWRQLPTVTDAVQCGGWVWRNIITWWKPGCRMQRGRFSSSSEYVVYSSSGIPIEGESSPQNVLVHQPIAGEEKTHIAQKPISLLIDLLGVSPVGGLVLDPFAGVGTTAIACAALGHEFLGFEIDPHWAAVANERIEAARIGVRPQELRAGQRVFEW